MPGLWKHNSCPIAFSLVVDNFGVKYVGKENAQHLLGTIQKHYKSLCDWEGEQYCGLTIKWDYEGRKVHLSMPTYVLKALKRFQHPPPNLGGPTSPPREEEIQHKRTICETA